MTETFPQGSPQNRARWEAFAVAAGVAALTILDISKINVGIPAIEHSLGGGATELQLLVAGYALSFGLILVPAGRLGDIHSRKTMFIIGLSSFITASLLCALAPTIEVLVIGRILQGVAAGIQMPQVLGLIQQLFQGRERGKAFGLFGAIIGLSTAFGPTLGGVFIAVGGETDGWRLLFWMNVPLGIIALGVALKVLPGAQQHERRHTELDLVGILLLAATVFCLMLPFVLTTGGPGDDPRRWFWLIGLAVAAALFVIWERRYADAGKSPVVDFGLFALPSYRNGIIIGTAYFGTAPALFLVTTLYLQMGLGAAAIVAGMVTIPFALASALASWQGGKVVERWGRQLVLAGLLLMLAGLILTIPMAIFTPPGLVPWVFAGILALVGVGGGLVVSLNQTLTLTDIPVVQGGVAGSVAQVGQRVGTAIGVAIGTSTFYATVYREQRAEGQVQAYTDGFVTGVLVLLAVLSVAIVFAVLDLRSERNADRRPVGG